MCCFARIRVHKTEIIMRVVLGFIATLFAPCLTAQNGLWTATDLNGTQWSMQTLLDQGKTVVVDVGGLTCPGRVGWHQGGVLQKLYREFGPEGTNDLMIFWVDYENSSTSTIENNSTGCDFLTGTSYPIISANGQGTLVADSYGINGGVHLFLSAPGSNTVYEMPHDYNWRDLFESCADVSPSLVSAAIDATLLPVEPWRVCDDGHMQVSLFSQGHEPLTSAQLELKENGAVVETLQWTGFVQSMNYEDVLFPNHSVVPGASYEVVVSASGETDMVGNQEAIMITPATAAPSVHLVLQIRTDDQPQQIGWELLEQDGTSGYHRVPGYYTDQYDITGHPLELQPDQCYTFHIYDTGGNGLDAGGYFRFKNAWGPADWFLVGEEYGAEAFVTFHTPAAEPLSVGSITQDHVLEFFPNPTTGTLYLGTGPAITADTRYTVVDAIGSVALQGTLGTSRNIDLSALPDGVYQVLLDLNGADLRSSVVRTH